MSEPLQTGIPDRAELWVFPSHSDGKPVGEPSGPFYSMADAIDHLLPGGIAVRVVSIAGTWLGPSAEWPVQAAK